MMVKQWLSRSGMGLVLLVAFAAPIPLGSNRPWAWSLLAAVIFATALIALAHLYLDRGGWGRADNSRALWLALLPIPLMSMAQCVGFVISGDHAVLTSADPGRTLEAMVRGLALLVHALALLYFVTTGQRLRLLLTAIVAAALFQALYAIALLYSGLDHSPVFGLPIGTRANGSFVYHNHLANLLMVSLCLGIGLMVSQFERTRPADPHRHQLKKLLRFALGRKMVFRLSLIIIVGALVLTRSRMGNSAFFSALLITALIALFAYRQRPPVFIWFVISIVAVDLLLIGSWIGLDGVTERLERTELLQEERAAVFLQALPAALDRPWTGHGGGSFYTVFNQYQLSNLAGFYDHAHNDYLELASDYGLPVLLLAGSGVLWCAWVCLRTMRERHTSLFQGTALGCLMAIIGMLIHCSVDFNLQSPANAHLFITVLTLAVISASLPRDQRRSQSDQHPPLSPTNLKEALT